MSSKRGQFLSVFSSRRVFLLVDALSITLPRGRYVPISTWDVSVRLFLRGMCLRERSELVFLCTKISNTKYVTQTS